MNRNVKWACIGGGIALAIAALVALVVVLVMKLMKGELYHLSLQAVKDSDAVVSVMGDPLEEGYFVTGNIQISGGNGEASIAYSVSGPLQCGKVYVDASRRRGQWSLDYVAVVVDEQKLTIPVID